MARTKKKAARATGLHSPFDDLSYEVITDISKHLPTKELGAFANTAKAHHIATRKQRKDILWGETDRINQDIKATNQKLGLLKYSGAVANRNLKERLDKLSTKKTMVATAKLNFVD